MAAPRLSPGFASSAIMIPGEDPEEFKALLYSLIAEHQPATITEQILVENVAMNEWLRRRSLRFPGYPAGAERALQKAHSELVKAKARRNSTRIHLVKPQNG